MSVNGGRRRQEPLGRGSRDTAGGARNLVVRAAEHARVANDLALKPDGAEKLPERERPDLDSSLGLKPIPLRFRCRRRVFSPPVACMTTTTDCSRRCYTGSNESATISMHQSSGHPTAAPRLALSFGISRKASRRTEIGRPRRFASWQWGDFSMPVEFTTPRPAALRADCARCGALCCVAPFLMLRSGELIWTRRAITCAECCKTSRSDTALQLQCIRKVMPS